MAIIITGKDIGGCSCIGDVLEVHTPGFEQEDVGEMKYYWTHAFDGETYFLSRFPSQDSAWMHYESMKSCGTSERTIGITPKAETEKKVLDCIRTMGKKFQVV